MTENNIDPKDASWELPTADELVSKANTSNITGRSEANAGMMRGIKRASDLIRTTYGPKGLNISVESEFYPYHQVANDAQTIIQAVHCYDPIERRGINFLKELMDKANKDSGDGRKTTCIIAEEILSSVLSSKLAVSGMKLKSELDALIPLIESKIDEHKQPIDVDNIHDVAAIAGESEELGKLVGDIYKIIGKDGIIHVEGSGLPESFVTYSKGIRFEGTGYLSPDMVHDEDAVKDKQTQTRAVYKNPTILVTKRKISHLNDINPLMERLSKEGKKDLVIFTDDMDSGVASIMVKAHKDRVMNILIIKAAVLWKQYVFEDFAKVVGATIVEDATGVTFKNLEMSHLGTCDLLICDGEKVEISSERSDELEAHMVRLSMEGSDDSKLRLSWLNAKTAKLHLGANNESELSHKRLKCHDAIHSSRLALRDGVVTGGGVVLNNISDDMPDTDAGRILKSALKAPLIQNLHNMGVDEASWEGTVLDAAVVVKNSVRNAVSLASTILTLGGDVSIPPKSAEQIAAEALKGKGMRF